MPTTSRAAGAHTALTVTSLTSLASSAAGTDAGWQSAGIDTSAATDMELLVKFKLGSGAITANTRVELWASAGYDDGSTITYTAGLSGSQGTFTPTNSGVKEQMTLLHVFRIPVTTTSVAYQKDFPSIAALMGGMPSRVAFFICQNSGAALSSTAGDQTVAYRPINYASS